MTNQELVNIKGGASLTSTVINSIVKIINTALELGRTIGSTIRRKKEGNVCKIS